MYLDEFEQMCRAYFTPRTIVVICKMIGVLSYIKGSIHRGGRFPRFGEPDTLHITRASYSYTADTLHFSNTNFSRSLVIAHRRAYYPTPSIEAGFKGKSRISCSLRST